MERKETQRHFVRAMNKDTFKSVTTLLRKITKCQETLTFHERNKKVYAKDECDPFDEKARKYQESFSHNTQIIGETLHSETGACHDYANIPEYENSKFDTENSLKERNKWKKIDNRSSLPYKNLLVDEMCNSFPDERDSILPLGVLKLTVLSTFF